MNRKALVVIAILIVAGATALIIRLRSAGATPYQFAFVGRGDVELTISSTGTLHPRSKVEVGTQISGTFSEIYVDYNDVVEEGDLLAELDATLLQAAFDEADALVLRSKEALGFSRADYYRNTELFGDSLLSEIDFLKSRSVYFSDSSACLSAR